MVHAFMIGFQVLFALLAYFILPVTIDSGDFNSAMMIVTGIFAVSDLAAAFTIYKKRTKEISEMAELKDKLAAYRALPIVRLALLSAPACVATVAYIKTGNPLFFSVTGLMILIMLKVRPTRSSVSADLQLSMQENMIIDDPDAVVGVIKE